MSTAINIGSDLFYNIQVHRCERIIEKDHRILTQLNLYQLDHSHPKYSQYHSPSNNQSKQYIFNNFNINSIFKFYLYFIQIIIQSLTPLNRPLYIEIQAGQPSPYLKQLLSKVGSSEIEFMDFTLQGQGEQKQQNGFDQQYNYDEMSPIKQQQQQHQQNDQSKYQFNPQEYIPNMHLLEIDINTLSFPYFMSILDSLDTVLQNQRKEYIMLYLTDQDLENHKDASIQQLLEVVKRNLQPFGIISRLERKAKVTRYLQKKKKRIWKKKINYDCRKKVADNRLRVKGKFVTRQQACQMLGIQLCSQQTLKELLKSEPKLMF